MVGFSPIFVLASVLFSAAYSKSESSWNCGTLVKSTCTDHVTSKWNKQNVGHHLKTWVKQIEKLTSLKEAEMKHFFSRKRIFQDPETKIVRYIGNVDCLSKRTLGPIWKTAGTVSGHQFHDGFLYGQEDENGTLTGMFANF